MRDADETSTVGSHDSGNGFDLNNDDQATDLVLSFVKKFVDKICDESGVNTTHKNSLHTKLYREWRRTNLCASSRSASFRRDGSNSNRSPGEGLPRNTTSSADAQAVATSFCHHPRAVRARGVDCTSIVPATGWKGRVLHRPARAPTRRRSLDHDQLPANLQRSSGQSCE